jgi:hypothetical protein
MIYSNGGGEYGNLREFLKKKKINSQPLPLIAWSDEIGLIDALPRASVEANPWQATTSLESN